MNATKTHPGRLWIVQVWSDRIGWHDVGAYPDLRRAESLYVDEMRRDESAGGDGRDVRLIRSDVTVERHRHAG